MGKLDQFKRDSERYPDRCNWPWPHDCAYREGTRDPVADCYQRSIEEMQADIAEKLARRKCGDMCIHVDTCPVHGLKR